MDTIFGLNTSIVALILVALVAMTVAAALWSAQTLIDERRDRA